MKINLNEVDYFGGCPVCGGNDGHLNVGRNEWMVCHEHKKTWMLGSGLFSDWHNENEEIWKSNWELLLTYEEIEPLINPENLAEEKTGQPDLPMPTTENDISF